MDVTPCSVRGYRLSAAFVAAPPDQTIHNLMACLPSPLPSDATRDGENTRVTSTVVSLGSPVLSVVCQNVVPGINFQPRGTGQMTAEPSGWDRFALPGFPVISELEISFLAWTYLCEMRMAEVGMISLYLRVLI